MEEESLDDSEEESSVLESDEDSELDDEISEPASSILSRRWERAREVSFSLTSARAESEGSEATDRRGECCREDDEFDNNLTYIFSAAAAFV